MTTPRILLYDIEEVLEKYVNVTDDCWIWKMKLTKGYGRKSWRIDGVKVFVMAHRWIYELTKGPIPEGLELDHLCRNRACVNPDHLEPVTRQVNHLRGLGRYNKQGMTRCKRGHSLEDAYQYGAGPRNCRQCAAIRNKGYYHARKK